MTSFSEDMVQRGMRPGSKTLSLTVTTAGASSDAACTSPPRSGS